MKLLYFLIALLITCSSFASSRQLEFSHVELPSTLSNKQVNCFLEDDRGFMWIGLTGGLVRYDGYRAVKVMSKNIRQLIKDLDGNIWVVSFSRLYKYDNITNQFEGFDLATKGANYHSIAMTQKGEIVVGTNKGFYIINPKNKKVETFQRKRGIVNGLSDNTIRCLYETKDGHLWIGTQDQLNKLDRKKGEFINYRLQDKDEVLKKNNLVLDILPGSNEDDSKLWIGTETGLTLFDTRTGSFKKYHHSKNATTLSNDVIKTLCRVSDNEIWLGTDLGLNIFNIKEQTFQRYFADYNDYYSISHNVVNTIYKDHKGTVWLGSNNGVDKVSFLDKAFSNNVFPFSKASLPDGTAVNNFAFEKSGDIWLATSNGLFRYRKQMDSFKHYQVPVVLHSSVNDVLIAKDGKVWITTPGGLNVFDPKTEKFYAYVAEKGNPVALQTNYLGRLGQSPKGEIWITTVFGLYKVNQKGNNALEFIHFRHDPNDANSISGFYISNILFNGSENPWISTGNGLDYFHIGKGSIKHFLPKDRENNAVEDIITDNDGNIWARKDKQIFSVDPEKKFLQEVFTASSHIRSFLIDKGMIWYTTIDKLNMYDMERKENIVFSYQNTGIKDYTMRSCTKVGGRYYFGGLRGFVSFDPEKVGVESSVPVVRLTALNVLNKEVLPNKEFNGRVLLDKNLNEVETVELSYEENTFSLYFSALDFIGENAHKYMFKLDGLEEDWQLVDASRDFASYIKTKPGEYTFMVKASDNFGKFSDEYTSINIVIYPPIWATWWAKVLYLIVLCVIFYFAKKMTVAKVEIQNKLKLEQIEREKSEEVNQMKIKFFTNISHELRTPLTLISSPLEELESSEIDTKKVKLLKIIKRNTDRLSRLVNQVLDLRKIDQGAERLTVEKYDIVRLTRNITHDFMETALQRNIDISFHSEEPENILWVDLEKVEKVIYNLLSNAIKFTPDKGNIQVQMDVVKSVHPTKSIASSQYQRIKISDTGLGIPKDIQAQIFERFTNIKMDNFLGQQGTGIGLSLVQDYVKMHGGWVSLESEEGKGSEFSIYLPLDKKLLEDYNEKEIDEVIVTEEEQAEHEEEIRDLEKLLEDQQPQILVVEDDRDMQSFLVHCLEDDFNVITANNGKEGWDIVKKIMPDMVVSDVMMPEMDGVEFCGKVKSDLVTNHIPVILLTAKSGLESKIEGIEQGADDYIAKPFNVEYLRLRVKKIITQREKLRESFKREIDMQPSEVELPSFEEKFLNDVMAEVEKNMDNSEFNVKTLGEQMGMSQTHLYRKIKSITGMTANEFIRSVRMKRAGQLLKSGQYNVSDVMYMVGFTHRSYFSKSFKEMYGMTPKEYSKG